MKTLFNEEAEKAYLGAVLLMPEIIAETELTASDFYIRRNAEIFTAMQLLAENGEQIDFITLCNAMKGEVEDAYITELIATTVSAYNAAEYAEIIREKARRRRLLQLASEIANTAGDEERKIDEVLPAYIDRLIRSASVRGSAVHIKSVLSEIYDEAAARRNDPSEIWGIPSGFNAFDRVTGGLQQGELMILSGVPGVGKSIFAMQLAAQMAESAPGVVYSMEMSSVQVVRRLLSASSGVQTRKIKTGKFSDEEWKSFVEAIGIFERLPIYISDSSGWTTVSLRSDLARLKARHGVKWFVLDYMYLLNDGANLDETERTNLASKGLKRAAKELGLAGIAVHSMTKAGMERGAPAQEVLRGSGQVVYDADLITFLTKYDREVDQRLGGVIVDKKDEDNVRFLWFAKGRELEDPRKLIRFVKKPGFPAFEVMA